MPGSNLKPQIVPTCETLAAGTATPSTLNTTVSTPDRLSVTLALKLAQPMTVVVATGSFLRTPLTVLVLTTGSVMVMFGGVTSTSQVNDAGEASRTRSRSSARTPNV